MARPRHRVFLTGAPRQEEIPDFRLDLGHWKISHIL
jgi:hypothetical protein